MYSHEQLMKARHDGWLRAAARGRLAAQTRRARAERAERAGHAVAAPGRRLNRLRLNRLRLNRLRLRQLFS